MLFKQVSEKLLSLRAVSYRYVRELSYPAEAFHSRTTGTMYLDFGSENDLAGFRYQFVHGEGASIFNNTAIFDLHAQNKTITMQNKATTAALNGSSALFNSIVTLRNLLPLAIPDSGIAKTMADTVIGGMSFYLLTFEINDRFPDYLGTGFTKSSENITLSYQLIVDAMTLLPRCVIQTRLGSQDTSRTSFDNLDTDPPAPAENSWYYSTYLEDYQPQTRNPLSIIEPGTKAPEMDLVNLRTGDKVTLAAYRGRMVLLEFWMVNCGHCIAAVSKLNELAARYGADELVVLGINAIDSEERTRSFMSRNNVQFDVLWGTDGNANAEFGIDSFPKVALLDGAGIVRYAGGLDVQRIMSLVDTSKNLR